MASTERVTIEIVGKDQASQSIKQAGSSLDTLKSKVVITAGDLARMGKAALEAAVNLAKPIMELEQQKVAFETMLGSAEAADQMLRQLSDFAMKTPFELQGIRQNSKMLLAMGIETEKIMSTLKILGDVSAGLNVPLERLALNFGQVKTQGKLTGRELKDFAVAGVPLIDELAKSLHKSKTEIADMVSEGKIGFPEVEAAFQSMAGEGGEFNDLMDKQSKTLEGLISNLKDGWTRFLEGAGEPLLAWGKAMVESFVWLSENILPGISAALNLVTKAVNALVKWLLEYDFITKILVKTGVFFMQGLKAIASVLVTVSRILEDNIQITYDLWIVWRTAVAGMAVAWNQFAGGLSAVIGVAINAVIESINTGLNWIADKINSVIDSVNSLGKRFGVNIDRVDALNIEWRASTEGAGAAIDAVYAQLEVDQQEYVATSKMLAAQNREAKSSIEDVATSFDDAGGAAKEAKEEIDKTAEVVEKLGTTYTDMSKNIKKELTSLESKHVETMDNINNKIKETEQQMAELFMSTEEKRQAEKERIAGKIVDTEEGISRIQQDISQKTADFQSSLIDLQEQKESERKQRNIVNLQQKHQQEIELLNNKLLMENQSLTNNAELIKELEAEISEVKRVNSLADLDREIEKFDKKNELITQEFNNKKTSLALELEELQISKNKELEIFKTQYTKLSGQLNRAEILYKRYLHSEVELTQKHADSLVAIYKNMQERINQIKTQNFSTGGIVQKFSEGGLVRGVGTQDTVPAMLTPGEVVLNTTQQKTLAGKVSGGNTFIFNGNISSKEIAQEYGNLLVQRLKLHGAIV